MSIEKGILSFPDFKLQEVIDPEEFDVNNKEIVDKINEMLDVLNQITDSTASGASGADAIAIREVQGFVTTRLQELLDLLSSQVVKNEADLVQAKQDILDLQPDTIRYALAQIDLFYLNNQMNMRPVTFNDLINKGVTFDTMKYAGIKFHTFRFFRFPEGGSN